MEGKRFNQKTNSELEIGLDCGVYSFITDDPLRHTEKIVGKCLKIYEGVNFLHCIEAIHKDWFLK